MAFTEEEIAEFTTEAMDLLDQAETALLAVDKGDSMASHYDAIFRVFHSLKGAAGMMEMPILQQHMHQIENIFISIKAKPTTDKAEVDFFLRGNDAARHILKGETVNFDYSLNATEAVPAAAPVERKEVSGLSKIGKVLVIDDEPDLAMLIATILEDTGFEVSKFTDPEQAIAAFSEDAFDVVISDISMPKIDGIGILQNIRKRNAEVPVIFISGCATKDYLLEAIGLGVYGVFEKPFQVSHIIEATINACKRHQYSKLLNRSINLLMYQFSDLDDYLAGEGKEDIRKSIKQEIEALLVQRSKLRSLKRGD